MRFVKFVGVGTLATGIHYVLLVLLVELGLSSVVTATTVGYVVSSLFNYGANYYFTFNSKASHISAAVRFYIVASIGLVMNSTVVFLLNGVLGSHYLLAQVIATIVVMCWNYLAHKHWTYVSTRENEYE